MAAYIKPRAPMYLLGLIGTSTLGFVFTYINAMGYKILTDATLAGKLNVIFRVTIYLLICICIIAVLNSFFIYQLYSKYRIIAGDIRKQVFLHIEALPMSFIENQHSADFISRLNNDLWMSLFMLGDPLSMLLSSVVSGVGSGIVIFALNWKLGIIALIMGIFNIIINTYFMEPVKKISKTVQQNWSKLNQLLSDTIAGTQVIRIFNLQKAFIKNYKSENRNMFNNMMKRVKMQSTLNGLNSFAGFMNFVGMTVIGSIMVINNQLTFGTLVAVTQLVGSFFSMFRNLGNYMVLVNTCLACAERVFETMDTPDEVQIHNERAASKPVRHMDSNVSQVNPSTTVLEFEGVTFGYSGNSKVLDNFNLKVSKDQVIAVVGSSGSGKSTLFKLILSFYEPGSGDILYYNKSCYEYDQKQLRKLIAYVPQDNYLFSGTIKENIAYGKPEASDNEIYEAAKAAFAHDFIMKLPNGYDTEVGERGAHLSGGERQRIAIARALLKDAPILLLDEATSSLDSDSEQQVQKALEVLMKGRTTMIIAHRLSTVEHADRIVVLEDGAICEEGTHETLLALKKNYARLYNLQFRTTAAESCAG